VLKIRNEAVKQLEYIPGRCSFLFYFAGKNNFADRNPQFNEKKKESPV